LNNKIGAFGLFFISGEILFHSPRQACGETFLAASVFLLKGKG
jgi:hypothetical protein